MIEISSATDAARTLAHRTERGLGAYYTPSMAARYMARWAIRSHDEVFLEPSMGSGEFLRAVSVEAETSGTRVTSWGVEIAPDTFAATLASNLLPPTHAILNDFLAVEPFPVDCMIGNPPFVRLRHLPPSESCRATSAAAQVLGRDMEGDGSLWMPFLLHATRFLRAEGRLAFVLPYDATYVRYARSFWAYLARSFGSIRVVRVYRRLFPDILQDVVILFADHFGRTSTDAEFHVYENSDELLTGHPRSVSSVALARVIAGHRPFVESLLPSDVAHLLRSDIEDGTAPAGNRVTFNIGYVSGDKSFFHPDDNTARCLGLPDSSFVPALTSARKLRRVGLGTSTVPAAATDRLYLPPADMNRLAGGELRYIAQGERSGVSRRYKCRVRNPWYVTPGVRRPDVIVPVFADRPVLLLNDKRYAVSNSLLAGFVHTGSARALAALWYTSLTQLQFELGVHSLGGGVLVLVPREAGAIRLPRIMPSQDHLDVVDRLLAGGRVDDAYAAGDGPVLQSALGLTDDQIAAIRRGVDVLRRWRSGRR